MNLDPIVLNATASSNVSASLVQTLEALSASQFQLSDSDVGEQSLLFFLDMEIQNRQKETFVLKSITPQLIPQFVFEEHPRFAQFIEKWCDFVERFYDPDGTKNPGPYYVLKNLLPLVDVDTTLTEFIRYHKAQYGSDLPDISAADAIHILKRVKEFYQTKGTPQSFEYFFRFVFNSFLRIELPKEKILRASGGIWDKPYLLRLKHIGSGAFLNATEQAALLDLEIVGETSGATAFLGYPIQAAVSGGGPTLYYMIPTKDRQGFFSLGETVTLSNNGRYYVDLSTGIQEPPGSWLSTDGFLSSNMRLQDSYFWQDFSYVLVSSEGLGSTVNPVLKNLHPAGFKLFARVSPESSIENSVWPEDWNLRRQLILYLFNWVPYTGELESGYEVEIPLLDSSSINIVMQSRIQAFYDGSQFQRNKQSLEWSHWSSLEQAEDNTINSLSTSVRQEKLSMVTFGGMKLANDSTYLTETAYDDSMINSVDPGVLSYNVGSTILSTILDAPLSSLRFISSYELPSHTESFSPNEVNRSSTTFSWVSSQPYSVSNVYALFREGHLVPSSEYTVGSSSGKTSLTITNPPVNGIRELYEFVQSPEWKRLEFTVVNQKSVLVPEAKSIESTLVFVNGKCFAAGIQSFVQDGKVEFSNPVSGLVVVLYSQNLALSMARTEAKLGETKIRSGDMDKSFFGFSPDRMIVHTLS
jgi:hypothetical protein